MKNKKAKSRAKIETIGLVIDHSDTLKELRGSKKLKAKRLINTMHKKMHVFNEHFRKSERKIDADIRKLNSYLSKTLNETRKIERKKALEKAH